MHNDPSVLNGHSAASGFSNTSRKYAAGRAFAASSCAAAAARARSIRSNFPRSSAAMQRCRSMLATGTFRFSRCARLIELNVLPLPEPAQMRLDQL